MLNSYAILAVLATAGYARAQSGLAVAMYVPHDLQTLEGTTDGFWRGSFEAPLTTNLRGDKAEWAAFCVDVSAGTCFSEPVTEITTGTYTTPGELIEFEVDCIFPPENVVCYVATVFEGGLQICSKPVLDYTVVGPVSNGNWNWAGLHGDITRTLTENPVLARISEAAKETVQMVQKAFGNLQKDAAKDIEGNIEAFSSSELTQLLSDEIGAVAEMIRPEIAPIAEAPTAEAPAVELQQQLAEEIGAIAEMFRPEIAPIVEAPVAEAPAVELQQQLAEEIGAIAEMIRPEIAPIAEAPVAKSPAVEAPEVETLVIPAGTTLVIPMQADAAAPAPEAANGPLPPVDV